MVDDILGVVLSGGRSNRFGSNKAFALFHGEKMIVRVLNAMSAVFSNVVIATNTPLKYESLGFRVIKDSITNRGPLGGIVTALGFADKIFVCACDMPFINKDVIELMVSREDKFNAVVARTAFGAQPLFAVYKKPVRKHLEKRLRNKNGSVREALNDMTGIAYVDIDKKNLMSINTVEELSAAALL